MEAIQYKGYTIQEDNGLHYSGFMFYPTSEGIDHDYDYSGDRYVYCGNCGHASTIDEAKDLISEKIMTSAPAYLVVTPNQKALGPTITKFWWIADAIKFAVKFNGELLTPIHSI